MKNIFVPIKKFFTVLVLLTVAAWQIQVAVEMGLAASRRPKPITPAKSTVVPECKGPQCQKATQTK